MTTSVALKSLLGAAALTLPLLAFGESNLQTGTTALTATAHVDFSIVIPKILYLRVGTGSTYTGATPSLSSVGTIDAITFSPAAGTVGNGTAVAGVGGDLTGGVETAAIVSNSGRPAPQPSLAGRPCRHRYWSTARVRASFSPHRQRSSSVKTRSGPTLTRTPSRRRPVRTAVPPRSTVG